MAAAKATAARVLQSPDERVDRAFRLAIGRSPSAQEQILTRDFLAACSSRREKALIEKPKTENRKTETDQSLANSTAAMEELCRALFNLNAFVYVD